MVTEQPRFPKTPRFEIIRRLGEGGMGIVYEAFDRERNSRVALKMVRQLTSDALQRFKNEFRSVQDLHHPNLVRLDQLLELGGDLFFTMELVEGVDFLRWVRPSEPAAHYGPTERDHDASEPTRPERGAATDPSARSRDGAPPNRSFDEERLRSVLVQLARGLCALHATGKVHRDIKPSNLIVTPEGRLVILDFGLVSDAFGHGAADGQITGTLSFMAPEQAASEAIGTDADWYAAGVVLYLALTGRPPFVGTPPEVLSQKQHHDPPPPSQLVTGVPPDLDILCRELLRRRPCDRPRGAEVLRRLGVEEPAGLEPAARSFFVGRQRELQRLGDCFGRAASGSATTVLVAGESGIGKSALLRRFVDDLDPTQTLVLSGRCYERESTPFKAFDEVMAALARALVARPREELQRLLPEHIDLAAGTFPALRRVTALLSAKERRGSARSHDPFQSRMLAFAALRELFGRLRRRQTLVIAIDDLQWADGDSLALISYLLSPPSAPPLLLCATLRETDSDPPGISALRAHLGESVFDLAVERLPHGEACELAEHLVAVSGEPGLAMQSAAVADVAGGHPMFIEALVRHRLRHPELDGPLRLDDAILERSAQLEPEAARLLGFVCVAGGPIEQEVCAHAAGLLFGDFARVISALRAAHLVKTRGVQRQDLVEPYHDRVREAVITRLGAPARGQIHACLAAALESSGRAEPETLAFHFWQGGDVGRAADYAVRAAEQAAEALAFAQSARWYRFALEHTDGPPARTRALTRRLAEALANSGHGREAAERYLQLADDAAAEERVELLRFAADQLLVSGHIDEGVVAIGAVLQSVGLTLPPTPRAALVSLAYQRARIGLHGSLLRYRRREASEVPASALTRIDACWSVGVGLAIVDPIRAADFQARHLRLSLAAGEPYRVACALAAEAGFAAAAGGPARRRVARLVRAAERLAEEVGHPNALGYAAFAAGAADYFVGRWRSSRETFDRAAVIFRDRCVGVAWWHQTVQYVALECLWYEGALAELCRRVPQLRRTAEARSDLYGIANLGIGLPNATALVVDDVEGARRLLATAMSGWSQQAFHVQHLGQLMAEVQTDLYVGDGERAYRRVTEAWPRIRDALLMRVQLSRITTHHQRARSALAAAAGLAPGSGARRRLVGQAHRDARRIEHERMAWADPLAALVRAGAARLESDEAAALSALEAAVRGFDAMGMGLYGAVARLRQGERLGGSEGAALVESARAWMRAAGIRRPERMAAALAPGF